MIREALSAKGTAWLWLSVPIVVLGLAAAAAGLLGRDTYARETANWAGQAVGQDIANVAAYVVLGVLALLAARGSVSAYLAWTGLLAYSVYTFAIYAFSIHFGRFFLMYVAVLGLSVYALVGGLSAIDRGSVKATFSASAPVRSTAILLIAIGAAFYLLWLSEIIPTIWSGGIPEALKDAGLPTSPVHVIDLAILLPGSILAGILLLKDSEWGYVLAPTLLGCFVFLSVGIVAAMLVLRGRGEAASMGVAAGVSVLTLLEAIFLVRFLTALKDGL